MESRDNLRLTRFSTWSALTLIILITAVVIAPAFGAEGDAKDEGSGHERDTSPPRTSPGVKRVPYNPDVFRKDPSYDQIPYDYQAQLDIYGAKYLNPTQRPLLELGRELYQYGVFTEMPNLLPFAASLGSSLAICLPVVVSKR